MSHPSLPNGESLEVRYSQLNHMAQPRGTHPSSVDKERSKMIPRLKRVKKREEGGGDLTRTLMNNTSEATCIWAAVESEGRKEKTKRADLKEGEVITRTVHCRALWISLSGKIPIEIRNIEETKIPNGTHCLETSAFTLA